MLYEVITLLLTQMPIEGGGKIGECQYVKSEGSDKVLELLHRQGGHGDVR